jgi:hypothetical protein
MPSSTVAKKHCSDLSKVSSANGDSTKTNFLKFVKISDKAHAPTKGSPLAAGYDLYSATDIVSLPFLVIIFIF